MDKDELKAWRRRHGFSQRQLASLLGVSPMCVAFWEWGKRKIPPLLPLALEALEYRFQKGEQDGTGD